MTVVCEGVETAAQHHELSRLGTGSCQGFYFARLMAPAGLETLIGQRADGGNPRLPTRRHSGFVATADSQGVRPA